MLPEMLAVTLLAIAGFMVLVVRLSAHRRTPGQEISETAELMTGFIYIGAAALGVLGVAVFVVARFNETFAANLGMLALFGGCAYLLVAFWFVRRR